MFHGRRERELLRFGLSAIRNDTLVKIRSHEDTRVRKGIGDNILIVDALLRHRVMGLTVWVMHDPDHAYE